MKTSLELYAPVFDSAVASNAKSLIILMVPPFALLPAIVFRRSRLPFVAHVTFALHFFTFMLLLISVALVVPVADVLFGGAGMESRLLDNGIAIGLLVLCATYLHLASGRVYGGKGVMHLLRTAVLLVAAAGIFLGYRFALLLITLYST